MNFDGNLQAQDFGMRQEFDYFVGRFRRDAHPLKTFLKTTATHTEKMNGLPAGVSRMMYKQSEWFVETGHELLNRIFYRFAQKPHDHSHRRLRA